MMNLKSNHHCIISKLGTACLIPATCSFLSCTTTQSRSKQSLQNFSQVQEGMEESRVVQILGKPSEVRTGIEARPVGTTHTYAYGNSKPGAFAQIGIVSFDQSNRVTEAVSPIEGYGIRDGAKVLPKHLDVAYPTSNILCVIKGVTYDPECPDYSMRQRVHFSLVNQSKTACVVPTPMHSVGLSVAVEVYDEHKRLCFRKDNGTRGPLTKWRYPTIRIEPGAPVEDEDCIWLSRDDFGEPLPGTYYIRVAFGFDPFATNASQFSVSKAFKFSVPNREK